MAEAPKNKYQRSGKAYYESHKDAILADEKEKKRWLSYYDRHREEVKERNRQQYYLRAGRPVPPRKVKGEEVPEEKAPEPPETPVEVVRLEALVSELRALLPEVMKKKPRVRKDRKVVIESPGASSSPDPALQAATLLDSLTLPV